MCVRATRTLSRLGFDPSDTHTHTHTHKSRGAPHSPARPHRRAVRGARLPRYWSCLCEDWDTRPRPGGGGGRVGSGAGAGSRVWASFPARVCVGGGGVASLARKGPLPSPSGKGIAMAHSPLPPQLPPSSIPHSAPPSPPPQLPPSIHPSLPACLPSSPPPLQVLVVYEPPDTSANRQPLLRGTAGFQASVTVMYAASSLFLVVFLSSSLLVLGCGAGVSGWYAHRLRNKPMADVPWRRTSTPGCEHPDRQRTRLWNYFGMGVALLVLLTGVLWAVTLGALRHSDAAMSPVEWVGVALAGAGLLLFVGFAVRVLRDETLHRCPVCSQPASPWRFLGTYVHSSEIDCGHSHAHGTLKAHTRCLRCVLCRRPVVRHALRGFPPGRRYHQACWDAHCIMVCEDPDMGLEWCRAQADVSKAELVALLTAAIERRKPDAVQALLARYPPTRATSLGTLSASLALLPPLLPSDVQIWVSCPVFRVVEDGNVRADVAFLLAESKYIIAKEHLAFFCGHSP